MVETKKEMGKEGNFRLIMSVAIFIGLAILVSSVSVSEITGRAIAKEELKLENFTECLNDEKIKVYGSSKDKAFKSQMEMFGESFDNLSYVDCMEQRDQCNNILTFPTWKIDGRIVTGVLSPSRLSKLTNCEL